MQQLLEGGYAVTNDAAAIDVISADASRAKPNPRRPRRRVEPNG